MKSLNEISKEAYENSKSHGIRICDFCGAYNIDLDKIIEEKMDYNKNREFKHNKKC